MYNVDYFFENHLSFHPNLTNKKFVWDLISDLKAYLLTLDLGLIKGTVSKQAYLIYPELITVDENAIVEAGAYIEGPCYIGKNSKIRHGAYLRGGVLTGENCLIGHATEVKNSIFFNHAKAAHFSYVGDSILGSNVNLGAGVKCANCRLDQKTIKIFLDDLVFSTNLNKLGAIIGDGSQIGCNVVTNPATLIGPNVICYPNLSLKGLIPKMSIAHSGNNFILNH
jgi:bifunctional UDP-N-acetylglucosamine pyrophosphorylase / glucosamine-1-phosphate N-acetyltransferase